MLALQWADIDWHNRRFMVRSSKTEHHEGGATRTVQLFPELEPILAQCFELAPEGHVHCVTRYRDATQNLRTTFGKIVDRAGVDRWVKPFQNLRSTRETELADEYPLHVVTAWLGNSQLVAAKHYLQVTDDHFESATTKVATIVAVHTTEQGETGQNADRPKIKKPHWFWPVRFCSIFKSGR